ncbi:MAG: YgiT-type zinc finger protein [Chloroflexota bacterium]
MTQPSHEFPASIPCPECQAGIMRQRSITYFTWLGQELITVPNFPAWVCDLCGKREYDERAVSMLNMLLNPEAGKPARRIKRTPQPDQPKPNPSHPRSTSG